MDILGGFFKKLITRGGYVYLGRKSMVAVVLY